MNDDTLTIRGNHGALLVHRPTGHVVRTIKGCGCGSCDGGYDDVMMFDPVDLAREADLGDEMDIVYIGYWDRKGIYEPANSNRMVHGEYGVDVDAVMPMSFLTGPDVPMAA